MKYVNACAHILWFLFCYLGYNPASDVHSCFSKHCQCGDKLHLSLLAGFGRRVRSPAPFTHSVHSLLFNCESEWTLIIITWTCLPYSGSAAANCLAQIYICAFMFAYIWWRKLHVTTWGGNFTTRCISTPALMISWTTLFSHQPFLPQKWASFSPCRLVCRITAGVGLLHEAGPSQHTNAVFWMVDLWDRRILCR